jgi:hypothetical protein
MGPSDQAAELRRMADQAGREASVWDLVSAVQEGVNRWAAWMKRAGKDIPDHEGMLRLRTEISDAVRELRSGKVRHASSKA